MAYIRQDEFYIFQQVSTFLAEYSKNSPKTVRGIYYNLTSRISRGNKISLDTFPKAQTPSAVRLFLWKQEQL